MDITKNLHSILIIVILIIICFISMFSLFKQASINAKSLSSDINVPFNSLQCAVAYVYLPVVDVDYYASDLESEPNDDSLSSTGPILSGKVYSGTLNDIKDYFRFYVVEPGDIEVHLIDPSDSTGMIFYNQQVQLQLFYTGADHRLVTTRDNIAYDPTPLYSIITSTTHLGTTDGWYYVYIYALDGLQTRRPYNLKVVFPDRIQGGPTPIPYPTCIPTLTPYPPLPFQCDNLTPAPAYGSHVLVFDGTKITPGNMTEPVTVTIPIGNYRVSLASYDELHGDDNNDPQTEEIWKLVFYDADDMKITESGIATDLPDDIQCDEQVVNARLFISRTVDYVVGQHGLLNSPDQDSIAPFYAVLEPLQVMQFAGNATPTPSTTPTLESILETPEPGN